MALDLDNDKETLEAALALIDEWELDANDLSSNAPREELLSDSRSSAIATDSDASSSTTSSSSPPPTTKQTAANVVQSRRRKARPGEQEQVGTVAAAPAQMQRREELLFLRRKIRDLEAHLTSLTPDNHGAAIVDSKQQLDPTWLWRQIASRQRENRQTSERENLRLRVKVAEQVQVAKDLVRVIMRAYQKQPVDESDAVASKRIKLPRDGLAVISEEDQLLRVHELHEESASIFASAPYATDGAVFRKLNLLEHENGETTINVDSSWVLPFPVEQVAHAFWKYLATKTQRMDCRFENCGVDDGIDQLLTRYESTASANRLVGKFVGRFAGKRFRPASENEPALLIWDMRAEPVDFKPMSMDGVRIHHETIMRVVYADQVSGATEATDGGRMALVQMSTRVRVQFATCGTPTRKRRVDALTNYLFYNVESELEWKQNVLETLLLRDAMLSSATSAGTTV